MSNRQNLHDDRLRSHLGHSSWYDYRQNQPYHLQRPQLLHPIPPPQWLHPAYMHPAFPHPQQLPPGTYLPLGHAPNQHWPAPPFGQPMRPPPLGVPLPQPQPQQPQQPQQPPLPPPAPEEEARRVSRVAVSGLEARLIATFLAVVRRQKTAKVGWLQHCFHGDLEWVRSLILHPELTSLPEKGVSKELYNSHFTRLLHSTRRGAPPEESSFIAIRDR